MRPWMGAAAVAAAMLVAPSAALANDDAPALLQFQLDNGGLYDDFEALGFDMDHHVQRARATTSSSAPGSPTSSFSSLALTATRTSASSTARRTSSSSGRRASRARRPERAAKRALTENKAGVKGKSAIPGSVRVQRADAYENYEGRYISIEANADGVIFTGTTGNVYTGPTLMAEIYDAAGNRIGLARQLGVYRDPDVNPDYYQYHFGVYRIGAKGDGGPEPASIKVSSSNGDVDTLAAKEWIAKDPPRNAATFKQGFVTRYNDSVDAYQKMRDLATEFANISQSYELPKKTWGYQRPAATMLGYANTNTNAPNATTPYVRFDDGNLPVAGSAPSGTQSASTVVLTSKAQGHLGGNSLTAQLIAPTGANQPLTVSVTGNAISVNVASGAAVITPNPDGTTTTTYPVTSTANQVIAAINANADASRVVRATKYRTASGDGIVTPGVRSPLSDLLRAPSYIQRGPQSMAMLRIGKQRDGTKVGVYLYCAEHSGEIATVGVCLETAERLVRNYGTDPQTTALVDNLDIFLVPVINGDGGIHSIYDSPRRTNMAPYCYDPANTENLGTRPTATATASTSTATSPSARSSTGSRARASAAPAATTPARRALRARDQQRGLGPEHVPQHQVLEQHPLLRWLLHVAARLLHPGARSAAVPAVRHAELLRPGREAGARPHQGPPRPGDPPAADRPGHRRALLGRRNSADEAYYTLGIVGYDFEIGDTRYNANGGPCQGGPGQQPPFGDSTNDCFDNEGFHEAMEFSYGNYGLMQSALDYAQRHGGAGRRHVSPPTASRRATRCASRATRRPRSTTPPTARRRRRRRPSTSRPRSRAAAPARPGSGHHAEVDRPRLQGQHVRREVAGARADPEPGTVGGTCRPRCR